MASTEPRVSLTVRSASDSATLSAALDSGALIVDRGRSRPFYFDGRFLTAADLLADQDYIRARQADLAQAMGAGVIRGLMVSLSGGSAATDVQLVIEPGSGITPAGDLVVLSAPQPVRLSALSESRGIEAQLGVKLLSTAGQVNRSGLYVLALRPVEFSANPVAAYPTTLDGARSVHDGDIVEAAAITLIPYPDRAGNEGTDAKRARVAREVFFEGQQPGALQQALPLAMICLQDGALRWLDVFMVRREVGAESTLAAGLQQRPRALLEAWLEQHQDQVDDIGPDVVGQGFAATRYFQALPPAGLVPSSTLAFENQLGAPTLAQSFFPAGVDCQFAFVPGDEIAALVADAMALPPIDLAASDEDLDHLSVLIVAPVTRRRLEQLKRDLQTLSRSLGVAGGGVVVRRSPLESLLRLSRPQIALPGDAASQAQNAALVQAWKTALADAQNAVRQNNRGCFWYVRRRQMPYSSELASTTVRLAGTAAALDAEVLARMTADAAVPAFDALLGRMPRLAGAEAVNLLAAPRLAVTPAAEKPLGLPVGDLLRKSVFGALERATPAQLDLPQVMKVARRYGHPRLGEGFRSMNSVVDADTRTRLADPAATAGLAASGVAAELDRAATLLPAPELADFARRIADAAIAGDAAALQAMVNEPFKT